MKNIREETNERTRQAGTHARMHARTCGGMTVLIFCRPRFATRIRAVTATTLLLRSFRMRVRERETVRQRERGGGGGGGGGTHPLRNGFSVYMLFRV